MNEIAAWVERWSISEHALEDLQHSLGAVSYPAPSHPDAETEAGVSQRERLAASREGARLWRNNVGALKNEHGARVRYGLCNDSMKMNKVIKSSDLIGIKPVLIKQHHVGQVIGQFVARETKKPSWKYMGTDREVAQLKFITLVQSLGGDAKFTS